MVSFTPHHHLIFLVQTLRSLDGIIQTTIYHICDFVPALTTDMYRNIYQTSLVEIYNVAADDSTNLVSGYCEPAY